KRDPDFTLQLTEAYLGGNKTMSEFFGKKVNVRRGQLEFFKKLKLELKSNPEEVVNQIFDKGGKIEDFASNLLNYEDSLSLYGNNRTVIVGEISLDSYSRHKYSLNSIMELKNVKVIIRNLLASFSYYGHVNEDFLKKELPEFVTVDRITLGSTNKD